MEKIVADLENMRLDAYISSKETNLSRTNVQRLIEEGNILVNGQKKKISYKVQMGDNIEINIPPFLIPLIIPIIPKTKAITIPTK